MERFRFKIKIWCNMRVILVILLISSSEALRFRIWAHYRHEEFCLMQIRLRHEFNIQSISSLVTQKNELTRIPFEIVHITRNCENKRNLKSFFFRLLLFFALFSDVAGEMCTSSMHHKKNSRMNSIKRHRLEEKLQIFLAQVRFDRRQICALSALVQAKLQECSGSQFTVCLLFSLL